MPAVTQQWKNHISTLLWSLLLLTATAAAQPANDDCASASVITIPNGGFALGTFSSSTDNISAATVQSGESFAPAILVAGQNKKSMWYKFTLPTTRAVRVTLLQPGTAVAAGNAGFAIYKAAACVPGNAAISTKLTPIATFGNTYHPCVDSGVYYIQVSSNNLANGPLYVDVQLSDNTGAAYDHPAQAYDFGTLALHTKAINYTISCQSIEDDNERCTALANYRKYGKTSWHTFTTPAYFDYLSVLLTNITNTYFVNASTRIKFGYKLYKGNAATTPIASLTDVSGCDSLESDGYYAGYKMYKCGDLEPNTTYTIQLFAHETFNDDIRLTLTLGGTAPTAAPQPVSAGFPASNNFGPVAASANGTSTTKSDYLACNSRHSITTCNPAIPTNGFVVGTTRYNLSTFFAFKLTSTAAIQFHSYSGSPTACGPRLRQRIYKQSLPATCGGLDTANLIADIDYYQTIDCLQPGDYIVQVLGTDTTARWQDFNYHATGNYAQCLSSNLGNRAYLELTVYKRQGVNHFSLSTPAAYDVFNKVNNTAAPLVPGITYGAVADTFGCSNTVRPEDTLCQVANTKVMYRQFVVADSGIATFTNFNWYHQYKLYKGDAAALATTQTAFAYPQIITGLSKQSDCWDYYTGCNYKSACVEPGTYTLATFGQENDIGRADDPSVAFTVARTAHYSAATAQNMGNLLDSLGGNSGNRTSDVDYFTCKDNAEPINGYLPCKISNIAATKAIYRQFYLKSDALVSIATTGGCVWGGGTKTLFAGKATDGLNTLTPLGGRWNCFTTSSYTNCDLLPAGWYTVVSYGSGPTYDKPLQNLNQAYGAGSYIGQKDQFTITITVCAAPKYNRPHKASVNTAGQPHLIQYGMRLGGTAAYPRTDTTFTLPTESFNCVDDLPSTLHPNVCDPAMKKVTYYVFQTNQPSYLQIDTRGLWGMVYALDVRTDSALMATPIQACVKSFEKIQLCQLPAGTYTLVLFNTGTSACTSVSPTIYIDRVGTSRFDHAANAYDFGVVPPDSVWHNGKVGDVNPLHAGRAPSNDFFYCTTGARSTDPANAACMSEIIPAIYNTGTTVLYNGTQTSNIDITRRNLWYTFVIDKPGWVRVKVDNKTIGKQRQYRYALYRSNVDGTLDFSTVVAQGQVDSTTAQGLTHIVYNGAPNYCNGTEEVSFYRDPCTQFTPQRYYVLVENRNTYWYDASINEMAPNNQLEVSILLDSVNIRPTNFDHYSTAYNFGNVGVGTHVGGADNFSCATRDATDPVVSVAGCSKTLWYKFTSTITGNVRYQIRVKGVGKYDNQDVQLFQQTVPGDSTATGLQRLTAGYYYSYVNNSYWMERCVEPGTYYLVLPGCNQVNEDVYAQIELVEQQGDFCSRPMVTTLNGAGTTVSPVLVNCHTIGTDYGEFNPTLSCPAGAETAKYKTSWFRLDITGNDSLDVTAYISENTNTTAAAIKYRMMTGNCGAMQEQSCVLDGQTQNTYKCLTAGSYYFQVFTPVTTVPNGSTVVTGDISLHLSAVKHADTCAPVNNCLSTANFIPQFNCNTDTAVRFVNFSTYGSAIQYQWDFGYNNQTSTSVSPAFAYPISATPQTYNATLKVLNSTCGGRDSVTIPITIPARPNLNLGRDTSLCRGGNTVLNATGWPGTTYLWNTGATTPTITTTGTGVRTYWVKATYNGCTAIDTVRVYVNTIASRKQNKYLCEDDSVQLVSTRNLGETHLWSTGEITPSIYADTAGLYQNEMNWYGCRITDTFNVFKAAYPLIADTMLCLRQPYVLNATSPGATGYQWQNNATTATFNVTGPGKYWVKVNYGTCTITDTVNIATAVAFKDSVVRRICSGQTYTLPSGAVISTPGIYTDTVRYRTGCDSLITRTELLRDTLIQSSSSISVCQTPIYILPWGDTARASGIFVHTLKNSSGCDSIRQTINLTMLGVTRATASGIICGSQGYMLPSGTIVTTTGVYTDTLRYSSGCDSLITTVSITQKSTALQSLAAVICTGENYGLPSGIVVSSTGIYTDTLRYVSGCDSVITTVSLTQRPLATQALSAVICTGERYTLPSGQTVTATGVYADTLHYATGCDSLTTTVTLSQRSIAVQAFNASICLGQSYTLPSGLAISAAGTYKDTLRYTAGCDSLISTLTLSVKSLLRQTQAAAVCPDQGYTMPSGNVVTGVGSFSDTLRYASGCDSLITTVSLTTKPVARQSTNATICQGSTYTLPSGTIANAAGNYSDTLRYQAGCDSMIYSILLSVKTVVRQNLRTAICQGQTYTLPSGAIISTAGTYADTVRYTSGCDSLISTVALTTKPILRSNLSARICAGSSYSLPSGAVVNTTGIYSDTVRYAAGCDSLISTTTLLIDAVTRRAASATICPNTMYTLPSGNSISAAGNYSDTLRNTRGCDSLITQLALTIQPKPTFRVSPVNGGVCLGEDIQLTATGGDNYQWYPAVTTSSPSSGTTQVFPTAFTNYKVVITSTACNIVDSLFVPVSIYPKPAISITQSNQIDCMIGITTLRASGGVNYNWSGVGIVRSNGAEVVIAPAATGYFIVQATSANGCVATDSVEVKVISGNADKGFLMPSAFTPNGDGKNDCFGIQHWGRVENLEMTVFNRWGEKVFYTSNPAQCWDGTVAGKPQKTDVYVYIITAKTLCGPVTRKGTVTLVR